MVLPSSGQIDLASIQAEFGGVNPIGIDEYYRNGSYITSNNVNVPTSGEINFANFYGAIAEIVVIISTTTTNLDVSSLFGSYWTQTVPKRVVINSGVIVGATNTSNYALNIPSGFAGTLKVDNNGSIQGAGGAVNSGTGGNAIFAGASGITINNLGTIYAGGGGGGSGGTGGAGYYTYVYNSGSANALTGCNYNLVCSNAFGNSYCASNGSCSNFVDVRGVRYGGGTICNACYTTATAYSSGGAGGSGGIGQGYNQSAGTGATGSAGGTNAGTGGTGGTGGAWGTTGSTGIVGANGNNGAGVAGTGGGLAGYYIVNNGNIKKHG